MYNKCNYIFPLSTDVGSGSQNHQQPQFLGQTQEPHNILLVGEVVDPRGRFVGVPCHVAVEHTLQYNILITAVILPECMMMAQYQFKQL